MRRALSLTFVLTALLVLLVPGSRIERFVAEPAPREQDSPVVKKLKEQRVKMLKLALKDSIQRRSTHPNWDIENILKIARQLREAERSLATRPEERRAAELAYFKLICQMDDQMIEAYEHGVEAPADVFLMRAARISAEIDLRQVGGAPPRDIKPAREIKDHRNR
jgi:hypothetical protein